MRFLLVLLLALPCCAQHIVIDFETGADGDVWASSGGSPAQLSAAISTGGSLGSWSVTTNGGTLVASNILLTCSSFAHDGTRSLRTQYTNDSSYINFICAAGNRFPEVSWSYWIYFDNKFDGFDSCDVSDFRELGGEFAINNCQSDLSGGTRMRHVYGSHTGTGVGTQFEFRTNEWYQVQGKWSNTDNVALLRWYLHGVLVGESSEPKSDGLLYDYRFGACDNHNNNFWAGFMYIDSIKIWTNGVWPLAVEEGPDMSLLPEDWNAGWHAYSGYQGTPPATNAAGWTNFYIPDTYTAAQLNGRLSAVGSGPAVFIFTNTTPMVFDDHIQIYKKSNIELRGNYAQSGVFQIRSTNNVGHGIIELYGDDANFDMDFQTNWNVGFTKGTLTIDVTNNTSMTVGSIIWLTQTNDYNDVTDYGNEGWCDYCQGFLGQHKTLAQPVKVTKKDGTRFVGIYPPLMLTNISATYRPQVYWQSQTATNLIIRNLGIDNVAGNCTNDIEIQCVADVLIQGVYTKKGHAAHVKTVNCMFVTMENCLMQDTVNYATQSYGIAPYNIGFSRFVSNATWGVTGPIKMTATVFCVFGYDYVTNQYYSPDLNWITGSISSHGSHCYGNVIEGNYFRTIYMDRIHGSSSHQFFLRNRSDGGESNKTDNIWPFAIEGTNRSYAAYGNILGREEVQNTLEFKYPSSVTTNGAVYLFGYNNTDYGTSSGDTATESSLRRSHNWNPVTSTNNGVQYGGTNTTATVIAQSWIYTNATAAYDPGSPTVETNNTKLLFDLARSQNDMRIFFGAQTAAPIGPTIIPASSSGRRVGRKLITP